MLPKGPARSPGGFIGDYWYHGVSLFGELTERPKVLAC